MTDVFVKVLNMSLTASYVALAVILIRLSLKRVPKIYSYMLWVIVFFRMICPISFESVMSLVPTRSNTIQKNIGYMKSPKIYSGMGSIDNTVNNIIHQTLPSANEAASVNPMQIELYMGSIIWIVGIIIIVLYSVISFVRLYKGIETATIVEENVYETDRIRTPFVLGFLKPRIYLPLGIEDRNYEYIISHEKTHIKRKDYIIKPIYFMAVILHWFNPLMWLSYYFMTKDMEMSCDEEVMKLRGEGIKADYAKLLFDLSVKQSSLLSPIAFGENNTKSRIKNVINYKKPRFWVIAIASILLTIAFIGLITNPKEEQGVSYPSIKDIADKATKTEQLVAIDEVGQGTYIGGDEFAKLIYDTLDEWKEKKVKSALELSPTFSVYLDISQEGFYDTEVCFYEEDPLAIVMYNENISYYYIPEDVYDKMYEMYAIVDYAVPGQKQLMNIILSSKKTNKESINDTPVNVEEYYGFNIGKNTYYIYKRNNKYYCERPYQFINEISETVYNEGVELLLGKGPKLELIDFKDEIAKLIEDNLEKIMSSPKESSNPRDYIEANDEAYENILKYGGEDGLNYMLKQFKEGEAKGLRGEIMMSLCKELLGVRNNIEDDNLSAEEWFKRLKIREEIKLPDFAYEGDDPIEKLVYETEIRMNKIKHADFTIVAPHIFGSYEEEDRLKVFITTFTSGYSLYEKVLSNDGGSIVPSAITYIKNEDGSYSLEKYEMSKDGALWEPSIREFCTMPVSGRKINGLADKIISHYSNYKDIIELERKNLIEHLKKHNQYGVFLQRDYIDPPDNIIPLT